VAARQPSSGISLICGSIHQREPFFIARLDKAGLA
jgi:hypothetical protein